MTDVQKIIDEIAFRSEFSEERALDSLLDLLHREYGFDFTVHKRPSVLRRIRRRVIAVGASSILDYRAYLERHPSELPKLFDMLLINVTAFFRDPAAWRALGEKLPTILDLRGDAPIRAWSAACSSGEEPYTLAIVLREALGEEVFARRVKIYATDIDEAALNQARRATYATKALEGVPPALVHRYFTTSGPSSTVAGELRRAVVFGRHDLVHDAPIQQIDVLACRNALMYFNAETQGRILRRLQYALKPSGLLMLGKAEMLLSHAELFSPVDMKLRLFSLAPSPSRRREKGTNTLSDANVAAHDGLLLSAFESTSSPRLIVDPAGRVLLANRAARKLLSISASDLGRPLGEIAVSYRAAELLSAVETASRERRTVVRESVERVLETGDKAFLDIEVSPLLAETGVPLGAQVTFIDSTRSRRLQSELRRANLEVEALQHALQASELEAARSHEALELTTQELQRTSTSLATTREELATMNEELEATSEELETFNEELRERGGELQRTSAFFGAVLGSMRAGIAVLDRDLRVTIWNARMAALSGAPATEVERRSLLEIDVGFPVAQIAAALRACVSHGEEAACTIDWTKRSGERMRCTVSVLPLRMVQTEGVIVLVEEVI